MKYRILSNLVFCFFVAIPFFSCINEKEENLEDVLFVGDTIPDFSVEINDGSTVSGVSLRNSPSVIVFFHTSCPDCQKLLPQIQELYNEYKAKGVSFLLISREEGEDSIEKFWKTAGLSMPYSAQNNRTVYELFAKMRVPRVYVSAKGGIIDSIFTDNPVPSYHQLVEALENIL